MGTAVVAVTHGLRPFRVCPSECSRSRAKCCGESMGQDYGRLRHSIVVVPRCSKSEIGRGEVQVASLYSVRRQSGNHPRHLPLSGRRILILQLLSISPSTI